MAWHKVITARPHPLGKPWGYCSRCSYVVVRFQDQWWHLTKKAQHRTTPRTFEEGC